MKRILIAPVLIGTALMLTGCLPMMALSAAQMAAGSARGTPVSNAQLKPTAETACSAQAARYGAVHVIDVQQAKVNKIIVWGTVGEGAQKQSFQCDFGTAITGFKLRPITPRAVTPAPFAANRSWIRPRPARLPRPPAVVARAFASSP